MYQASARERDGCVAVAFSLSLYLPSVTEEGDREDSPGQSCSPSHGSPCLPVNSGSGLSPEWQSHSCSEPASRTKLLGASPALLSVWPAAVRPRS